MLCVHLWGVDEEVLCNVCADHSYTFGVRFEEVLCYVCADHSYTFGVRFEEVLCYVCADHSYTFGVRFEEVLCYVCTFGVWMRRYCAMCVLTIAIPLG